MNCLILVSSISLSRYHIPQCLKGMTQNHPWSAIAHYFANPGSHFRSVTMHSTFMALGLLLTEPAMLKSCKWIVEKRLAFFTKSIPTVFPAAPQFNHMPHRPLLPFYSSHILHNNKPRKFSNPQKITCIIFENLFGPYFLPHQSHSYGYAPFSGEHLTSKI